MSYTYEEKMEKLLEEQKKYRDNLVLCKGAYEILQRKLQLIENTHKEEGFRTIYKTDRIKSDSKYLGFMDLAEIALSHEMAGKSSDEAFIENNYASFIEEINRIVSVVKEYLGR